MTNKCPCCPLYPQTTSYGTEWIECNNKECPHHSEDEEGEE